MDEILTLLNRVNRQAQVLVHLPNMARIDVDLLLAELRQVYDKTLDLQLRIETTRQEIKTESHAIPASSADSEFIRPSSGHPEVKVAEPTLVAEPEIPKPKQSSDYEYSQPKQIVTPLSATPSSPIIASPPAPSKSLHEAYEQQNPDQSIASRLQYNPIHDLRSAIGINDKFLLMNELFKGSLEQYNAAIERLNNFYNYEEAEIFMGSLKILHDWADDLPAIERLQYFVKRRFHKE